MEFEVLTAVIMKSSVFWDITPCSPVKTASVVSWSEFLATDPKVTGSITGPTRFSEK
jgi:hypothetical protein